MSIAVLLLFDAPYNLAPAQLNEPRKRIVKNRTTILMAGCLFLLACGCRAPGPVYQQQNAASYHDPYADNDAGPEVVGGRPREFQKPNAEPVRNRWYVDNLWGR